MIAACGQFFTTRGPSPCISCGGGRRSGCACEGCANGQHRVIDKANATYSEGRERNRRQHNSDLFQKRPRSAYVE